MSIRDLSAIDRTVFQPLGRLLQEAFSDGLQSEGHMELKGTGNDYGLKISGYTKVSAIDIQFTWSAACGSWVSGMKFECGRSGNDQVATAGMNGIQAVVNMGTGTAPTHSLNVIQAVLKGSGAKSSTGATNILKVETQSDGACHYMQHIQLNSGGSAESCLYVSAHANTNAAFESNVQGGTMGAALSLVQGGGGTLTDCIKVQGTAAFYLHFAAATAPISADSSSVASNRTHKIKCQVGSTTFYLNGYAA